MAALTAVRKYRDGAGLIHALYLQTATAADTLPLAADFAKILYQKAWSLSGAVEVVLTQSGTTLTVPAGPASDDLVVLVVGAAA